MEAATDFDLRASVDARRQKAAHALETDRQAELGQFFTPAAAADLIAGLLLDLPSRPTVRVLDPGAGIGSLAAAATAQICADPPAGCEAIHLVAYEIDPVLCSDLEASLADCDRWAAMHQLRLSWELRRGDYLQSGITALQLGAREEFEAIVMNPPYKKIGTSSRERKLLETAGIRISNLYTAFAALGAAQLADGGVLSAITPRSFANGLYHEPFRRFLFEQATIEQLHLFDSRKSVFSDSAVLQENVIFSARRGNRAERVVISTSHGAEDEPVVRSVPRDEVVNPADPHRFLRIPSDAADTSVAEAMASLEAELADLDLKVSTGPVVDFRAKEFLRPAPGAETVPLTYPHNLRDGRLEWPRENGRKKPQAIVAADETRPMFLPNAAYVVVKRFTSKEERRRVSAIHTLSGDLPGEDVAFENHLNVFHRSRAGLPANLARGLAGYLNSSFVDRYVRVFSGHTQINATDLRQLRYPTVDALTDFGAALGEAPCNSQAELDRRLAEFVPRLEALDHDA